MRLDSPPPPSAKIAYRLSGSSLSIQWSNEVGLAPFTRISVFDAGAVSLHVDNDLGYVYTPAELALFAQVAAGIQGVQQRIAAEVASLSPETNQLLSKFTRGTRVYPLIETLGSATDLAEIDAMAVLPEDAEADRERLESEIAALRSNILDALAANAHETERHLTRLHSVLNSVTSFDEDAYEAARAALETAETRRVEAREQLFSPDELPGPPDENWQEFVVAGDSYRQHLGQEHYPRDGDACLYCLQALSPAALNLLTRYRTFLDETLVQQVTEAKAAVERAGLILEVTELTRASEFATEQRDAGSPATWASAAVDALDLARITVNETRQAKALSENGIAVKATTSAAAVAPILAAASATAKQLVDDRANAATVLAEKQKELAELTARLELKRNLAVVRDYIRRAKRAEQLSKLSRVISNGAAKQLTTQSKLASEDLVNRNFETLFHEECERLRAPQVALRFQGGVGRPNARKSLRPTSRRRCSPKGNKRSLP